MTAYTPPNYTVGSGKVYLARSDDPAFGERYVGPSSGFSYSPEIDTVSVYDSVNGVIQKTDTHVIRIGSSFSLSVDDITDENLALFMLSFGGTTSVSSAAHTKNIKAVRGGLYDLEVKAARSVVLTRDSDDSVVPSSYYSVDSPVGLLKIADDADLYYGQALTASYIGDGVSFTAPSVPRAPYKGPLRYVEDNLTGESRVLYIPSVVLYPDEGVDLKSSSWRSLTFKAEVTSEPAWVGRRAVDDFNEGQGTEDFGDLSVSSPSFTDDYGVT